MVNPKNKALKTFWHKIFHNDAEKVPVGSDKCPLCMKPIPIPLIPDLGYICPHCREKLQSVLYGKI